MNFIRSNCTFSRVHGAFLLELLNIIKVSIKTIEVSD